MTPCCPDANSECSLAPIPSPSHFALLSRFGLVLTLAVVCLLSLAHIPLRSDVTTASIRAENSETTSSHKQLSDLDFVPAHIHSDMSREPFGFSLTASRPSVHVVGELMIRTVPKASPLSSLKDEIALQIHQDYRYTRTSRAFSSVSLVLIPTRHSLLHKRVQCFLPQPHFRASWRHSP